MPSSPRPPDRSPYPQVAGSADFPAIEREVLAYWDDDRTFEASVKARSEATEYVFYDGPPFANGMPHYGHLLTGYVKDAIPRYKTMRGWRVERRFGWDCHGLPAEMEAVKELGLPTLNDIEDYGIGRFNDYCRTSVLRYTGRMGTLRRAPSALGRFLERLQDNGPFLYGKRDVGVQAAPQQRLAVRGL